ncbi:HAD-IA family hydrolase [Nonomuraea sp. NPDC049709]|uniref:HAD-IA family hydrolase n=1 Tax=Nonomuraea sp. NPDC049709 TaxID=3154736 RepID=UPI00342B0040
MTRLALFDLDRTLLDLDTAFVLWAGEFAERHRPAEGAVERLVALHAATHPDRERFFARVRRMFGVRESAEALMEGFHARMPHLAELYAGVPEALAGLRAAGWRVGVVTNGPARRQLAKIRRTRLDDLVDGYAISGAEGVRKPAVELFAIAARRCGADLGQGGWMVGDNLIADIGGARAAGLRRIWIDHGTWPGHEHGADHVAGTRAWGRPRGRTRPGGHRRPSGRPPLSRSDREITPGPPPEPDRTAIAPGPPRARSDREIIANTPPEPDRTARYPQGRPLPPSPSRWQVYRRAAGQPARGGGGVVMEAKEWTVRISLAEDGDDTAARATLTMGNGDRVTGTGRARRNPADPAVPEIGDELAASRALADLAERLAVITKHDISETTAEFPAPTRSW